MPLTDRHLTEEHELPSLEAVLAGTLARNSFEASFADAGSKSHWINQLDLAFEAATAAQ